MDERPLTPSTVLKLSGGENNTDTVVLNYSSVNNVALQDISLKKTSDDKLSHLIQRGEKGSLEPCVAQEKEKILLQLCNQLPCCSTTGTTADFTDKIVSDSDGLFVPWELYQCMGFDLLRPLAKLQALQNMNLYHAIRNELRRRGKNGGLKMLNIACEIAVPGYLREIRALWDSYSDAVENGFEFAFMRIISFLHWANANIYPLTDLGPLNVEKLMLCYNCRWGETSAARKYFDVFMRQILFDMKDLLALRSWCGILREKTVIDLAMARADYLVVLDLGTIATKGPFKKWNLKELFVKLRNLEDFIWLNCDVRTLVYLASVNSLKKLILHITKYDHVFFEQFFVRFGFDVDADPRKPGDNKNGTIHDDYSDLDSFSSISASQCKTSLEFKPLQEMPPLSTSLEEKTGDQVWISVKPSTNKVHLDYAALSFSYAIWQSEEHYLSSTSGKVSIQPLRPQRLYIPPAVIAANTVVLNVPPILYQHNLLNFGISKKKIAIGLPKEICGNINPNRTSYGSVMKILQDAKCDWIGRGTYVEEIEIHVMFDYYRKERVVHLFNFAMMKFFPKILRLHFTSAGRSMKKYYRWLRSIPDNTLFLRHLTVFELTLNCLTFQVPNVFSYPLTPNLEEVYITLCGLPYNEHGTIQDVMKLFQFFMQPKKDLRTVIFRINAPCFFTFFETLSMVTAGTDMNCLPVRLETLGIVCCIPETKIQNLSSRICNAIESIHPFLRKQLKKLILDGRVWGALSAEHFAYIQDLLLDCTFEAELAPDNCKDLKYYHVYKGAAVRKRGTDDISSTDDSESTGSESPTLDDGDEYLMRSDYSDATEEKNENPTFAEIFASKVKKDVSRNRSSNRSQFSSSGEVGSSVVEHSSRKTGRYSSQEKEYSLRSNSKQSLRKVSLRIPKSVNESSDEEWNPGTKRSKKRKRSKRPK